MYYRVYRIKINKWYIMHSKTICNLIIWLGQEKYPMMIFLVILLRRHVLKRHNLLFDVKCISHSIWTTQQNAMHPSFFPLEWIPLLEWKHCSNIKSFHTQCYCISSGPVYFQNKYNEDDGSNRIHFSVLFSSKSISKIPSNHQN